MARLTSRDELGNAQFVALEENKTPETHEALYNVLAGAVNKLADYEDAEEKEDEEILRRAINIITKRSLHQKGMSEEMREFILLVLENPELPVVPMVYSDCVAGNEDYAYWLSKVSRSEIREFAIDEWYHDGAIVYRDEANAEEILIEAIAETKYNGTDEDYEKAKEEAAGLWTKAIIVYITTT